METFDDLTSLPLVPEAPTGVTQYGWDRLALFETYSTRQAFREAHAGVEPPRFRTDRPVKHWFNTEVDGGVPKFRYPTMDPSLQSLVAVEITWEEARSINIPGPMRYQLYVPEPTEAFKKATINNSEFPINDRFIALKGWAESLLAELPGASKIQETSWDSQFVKMVWGTELRRPWQVLDSKGRKHNAGALWFIRHQHGIGRGGRWTKDWVWIPDSIPPDPRASWQKRHYVPLRALAPGEAILKTPFGPKVINKAVPTPVDPRAPAEPVEPGGGLTEAQDLLLKTLAGDIAEIKAVITPGS